MKTIFLLFIYALFPCLIHSQTVNLFPADTTVQLDNVDLSTMIEISTLIQMQNETTDTLEIIWRKEIASDCPLNWGFIVGDINITYPPFVYTNYNPSLGINTPFSLLPSQLTMGSYVGLLSDNTPGCCQFYIHYSELNNPDSIIATLTVDYRINDPDCSIVKSEEEFVESIKIYPNPTTGLINVSSVGPIENVQIYDLRGVLQKINDEANGNFNLNDLAAGLYILKIELKDGRYFWERIIRK